MTRRDDRDRGARPAPTTRTAGRPPDAPAPARRNVVAEIAARRRADIDARSWRGSRSTTHLARRGGAAAAPDRSTGSQRPGLHLIAEIKRSLAVGRARSRPRTRTSSPARAPTRPAAPPRSPSCASRTGSAARSTTSGRSAPPSPSRSSPRTSSSSRSSCRMLRAAGADLVLLLAVLHPAKRLAQLVDGRSRSAWSRSSRSTTRASSSGRSPPAPGSSASTTATCGRSRSTSSGRSGCATLVPDDRLVIAESGVRDAATIAAGGRVGFDGALVGEALVRSADPGRRGRARSSPPGRARPTRQRRAPAVRQDLRHHRRRRGPRRGPRRCRCDRAEPRRRARRARSTLDEAAALARAGARVARRPAAARAIVAVTADADARAHRRDRRRARPRRVQLTGDEAAGVARPWRGRTLEGPPPPGADPSTPTAVGATIVARGRACSTPAPSGSSSTPPAARIRAGPGCAPSERLAAAVAREVPITLAGGLTRPTSPAPSAPIPAVGVDVASGVERAARRRRAADQGPAPRRALREARPGRPRRPPERSPFGPTPVHAGPPRRRRRRADGGWSAISAAATSPRR